jgi:hypothetical protein
MQLVGVIATRIGEGIEVWHDAGKHFAALGTKHANLCQERAGLEARVDHRSHAERGIEELPGIHLGPAAHMEARGIPTERGEQLRDIKAANHELREAYSALAEAERIVRQAAEREPNQRT